MPLRHPNDLIIAKGKKEINPAGLSKQGVKEGAKETQKCHKYEQKITCVHTKPVI